MHDAVSTYYNFTTEAQRQLKKKQWKPKQKMKKHTHFLCAHKLNGVEIIDALYHVFKRNTIEIIA